MNGSGEFLVVWNRPTATEKASSVSVLMARAKRSAEKFVSIHRRRVIRMCRMWHSSDSGNAVVVWTGGNSQDGDTDGIFGQRLADFGGLSFTSGDGSNDASMVFTGTVEDINDAISGLKFTPTTSFTGVASINFVVDDQGNSGSGGPQVASESVYVIVGGAGADR